MGESGRLAERDELAVVLRLYHDLRDGRRDDEEAAVRYLSRLMGAEPVAIHAAMAGFFRVDPRRKGMQPGSPSAEIAALWQEAGEDHVEARRLAGAGEDALWRKHGRQRMDFQAWEAELYRIWDHEDTARSGAKPKRADAERAFEDGRSPLSFYQSDVCVCTGEGSIDDIPVLGEDD